MKRRKALALLLSLSLTAGLLAGCGGDEPAPTSAPSHSGKAEVTAPAEPSAPAETATPAPAPAVTAEPVPDEPPAPAPTAGPVEPTAAPAPSGALWTEDQVVDACDLALRYYQAAYDGYTPGFVNPEELREEGVLVHLYDDMGTHVSTCAWYLVNPDTMLGSDYITGETIDFGNPPLPSALPEELPVMTVTGGREADRVELDRLPLTAGEVEELLAQGPDEPARVCALFFGALNLYLEDPAMGAEAIDLLRGPRPMTGMDEQFIRDRLRDKAYLTCAYFEGATPENNYLPDEPLVLRVLPDPRPQDVEEGYLRVYVETTGADSPRPMTLRSKQGEWFLWEYSSVLSGIRLPAALDSGWN